MVPARTVELGRALSKFSYYILAVDIALFAALSFIWAPVSLILPAGRDQGIFAWVAEVMLQGGLPYADAWEVKGPAAHFAYALALLIFGKTEFAIRAFDLVVNIAGVMAAARIGKIAGRRWVGFVAAGVALGLSTFNYWEAAQPDGWAAIALLWMVALIAVPKPARAAMGGAGALLGLAVLVKPHYALFGLLPLARIAMEERREERLPLFLASIGGGAVPIALCLAVFAAAGKLGALWDVLVLFNLKFHSSKFAATEQRAMLQLFYLFCRPEMILAVICAGVGWLQLRKEGRPLAVLLPLGVAAGLVIAFVQGKFWVYHFLAFDFFLAVLAAAGVAILFDEARAESEGRSGWLHVKAVERLGALSKHAPLLPIGILAVAQMLTLVAIVTAIRIGGPWAYVAGYTSRAEWRASFCAETWDFCHPDIEDVAAYIKRETKPGEPIYLWGFDPLLYVLADRPAASRLGYSYAVLGGNDEYRRRAEAELMDDLEKRKPVFIVVQTNESNDLLMRSSQSFLPEVPRFEHLLDTQYAEAFRTNTMIAYRRKPQVFSR